MAAWRVARCIEALRAEINNLHPGRPTAADGTIGDARHQAEVSDHNPNAAGVVTAWDITTAPWSDDLAETLRGMGLAGDGRVKYVIWNRRIASAVQGWAWRAYSGADPHTGHIHLSVSADPKQYDRIDPWLTHSAGGSRIPATSFPSTPTPVQEDDMTPEQAQQLAEVHQMLTDLVAPRRTDHADTDPKHVSLGDVLTEVDNKAGMA